MNIVSTQFTLSRKALEIYISGCNGPHCINCHNKELWEFNIGDYYKSFYDNIESNIKDFNLMIDNLMIFGGEPLDQDLNELEELLIYLSKFNKNIWLFTRYDKELLPEFIKKYCSYIKCGRYLPELSCENNIHYNINLSTSNQYILKKGIDY